MARNSEISLCIKYLLFFFNVFFWLLGGITLGVGAWARLENSKTATHVNNFADWDLDPAILLIAVGLLIFLLGFCGCVGALRENIFLLKFFSIFLSIIFFLQLAAGIIGFIFRDKIQLMVAKKLEMTIVSYRDPDNPDMQSLIDYAQATFKCCGLHTYDDWQMNIYFNCSSEGSEACGVPNSCCITDKINSMCGFGIRDKSIAPSARRSKIFTRGCIEGVTAWFREHLIIVGGVGIGVAVLQILGIGFATTLMAEIRKQIAKWQRPEQLLPRQRTTAA